MDSYVLFIHDDNQDEWETLTEAEQQVTYDTDYEFGQLLEKRGGKIKGGAELTHSREARVRRRDQSVTEGPFSEAVEVLSGFYIVESPDRETLVELAETLTRVHALVEIRPVVSHD